MELRRYCEARGWTSTEFVDTGISGVKDRRPALDALLKDAKRQRFDVLIYWRLDRNSDATCGISSRCSKT